MSGASLPTEAEEGTISILNVLIPDEWGKSSDVVANTNAISVASLNPR